MSTNLETGRNYCFNSNFNEGMNEWRTRPGQDPRYICEVITDDNKNWLHLKGIGAESVGGNQDCQGVQQWEAFYTRGYHATPGTSYTLSATVKGLAQNQSFYMSLRFGRNDDTYLLADWGAFQIGTEEQRVSHTFIAPDEADHIAISFGTNVDRSDITIGDNELNEFYITDVKLEEGNFATSYSLAPEDIHTKATITRRLRTLKRNIENARVELDFYSVTYDGNEHVPKIISVTNRTDELIEGQDYYTFISPQTNAGNYNILLYGINDYSGIKTLHWQIEKKEPLITITPPSLIIEGAKGTTVTVKVMYTGDGELSVVNNKHTNIRILSYDPIFKNNTWQQIAEACKKGEVPSEWKIGDIKEGIWLGEKQELQIIGKNHDDLDPTDIYYNDPQYNNGTNKAALTLLPVSYYSKSDYRINNSGTNETSWENCWIRTDKIPELIVSNDPIFELIIRTVTKKTGHSYNDPTIILTADKFFLLSEIEISGTNKGSHPGEGIQYEYFSKGNDTRKYANGTVDGWWTRSPYVNYDSLWNSVSTSSKYITSNSMTNYNRIVTGFCI